MRSSVRYIAVVFLGGTCLSAEPPDFVSDVQPIFERYCTQCHGAQVRMGELDLRTPAGMLKGGTQGPAIVEGSPGESLLLQRIVDQTMPMGEKKVSSAESDIIRRWIAGGAIGGADDTAHSTAAQDTGGHWAFQAPVRPRVPLVSQTDWIRTPIDAFVLKRLEAEGIQPVASADKRTWLRRVYFTLIGLPPTPAEVKAFLADNSPDSQDRVVEDLLSRPQYGERWARHWLDVVRYAETNGYERDSNKPSAWRYRDYVIGAFNDDKPFDRFVAEQLAGDEIEGADAESWIATTFLRLGNWDDEPADESISRYDELDDVLGVMSTALLGLTLRCARCHDHKFEPFSQRDYYRMLAIFEPLKRPAYQGTAGVDHRTDLDHPVGTREQLAAYREALARADAEIAPVRTQFEDLSRSIIERVIETEDGKSAFKWFFAQYVQDAFGVEPHKRTEGQRKLIAGLEGHLVESLCDDATAEELGRLESWRAELVRNRLAMPEAPARGYVWYENSPTAAPTRLLQRGDPYTPGDVVEPGTPEAVPIGFDEPIRPSRRSTGRRLWLARWMTHPRNPLVARVMVNRIWQWHFGEGLVASESDFGVMGQRPSHPELLDYLATEFIDSDWSIKHIQRLIVKSNTVRLSSAWNNRAGGVDPDNRLLWRWQPRRLEAEAVRDAVLAVSGRLNPTQGGPSVYPKIPQAVLDGQSRPGDGWGDSSEIEASRRSVYVFSKRTLAVPELEILDMPDNSSSCEQRRVSTTGPQALTFLNGDFIMAQAEFFASRLEQVAGNEPHDQIRAGFELAFARPPSEEEVWAGLSFLTTQRDQIQSDGETDSESATQRALKAFGLTLLNSNEFFYLN